MSKTMSDARRSEIELVVALAVAELDLQFTNALNALREEVILVPSEMDKRIKACVESHRCRDKWFIRTMLTSAGVCISFGGLALAIWRF